MVSSAIVGSGKVSSVDATFAASNVKADKVSSFGDVMAKSLADNSSVNSRNSQQTDAFKATAVKKSDNAEMSRPDNGKVETDDVKTNAADDANAVDNSAKVETEAEKAAKDILDKVQEELNVSEEELKECMEVLGLSLLDLLQPGNILKLVMEVTGTQDAMAFVTDADLSNVLKNILDYAGLRIGELADQLDMSVDELQTMLGDLSAEQASDSVVTEEAVDVEAVPETIEDVIASKITVDNNSNASSESGMQSNSGNQKKSVDTEDGSGLNATNTLGNAVSQLSETFQTMFNANVESVNSTDIVRQVIDSIKLTNTQALQSIEVQLNPENLGKVNVMVSVREGVVTAQIVAENEQVKRAIESQVNTLKETFEAQGIKVEAVEVTVRSHEFENNQAFEGNSEQDNSTSKAKKKINLDGINFDDETEEKEEQVTVAHENSSVEYMA